MVGVALTDFAVAVWREDGRWQAGALPDTVVADLDQFVRSLKAQPTEGDVIGLACVAEEFFIAARVHGTKSNFILSDVLAATEFPIASEILQRLDLPFPDEEDESQPAGDLNIFADLGVDSMELAVICDDLELFPDEQLEDLAGRLGFGEQFNDVLDSIA